MDLPLQTNRQNPFSIFIVKHLKSLIEKVAAKKTRTFFLVQGSIHIKGKG
jgi:hypothetical protein